MRVLVGGLLIVMIPLGLNVWTGNSATVIEEHTHHVASYEPELYAPDDGDDITTYLVLGGVAATSLVVLNRGFSSSDRPS